MLLHDVIMTSYCRVSGNDFVFQQDSAPTHRAAHVQQLNCCVKKCEISCVQTVASKQPRSQSCGLRDLSPVDYEIWTVMQHRVYHRQIHSVDELKRRLIDVWCSLEQSIFDKAIVRW